MYWKAAGALAGDDLVDDLRKASTGNVSGLGWPGAKEMIPGFSMSALIRRMAEKRMPRAALEKRWSQAVAVCLRHLDSSCGRVRRRTNAAVYPASRGHSPVPGKGRRQRRLRGVS